MTIKFEILHLCEMFGINLKKEKGQNFLISENILETEILTAKVDKNDIVMDIGAGFGFLTEKLVEYAKKVYAVELDPKIANVFTFRLGELLKSGKLELIIDDVLNITFPRDINKIVSNPPYSISSDLIVKIVKECLDGDMRIQGSMILQKDFVKRLLSKPCSKNWGRISALFNYYMEGEFVKTIKKDFFYPRPEVDSALIRFKLKEKDEKGLNFDSFEKLTLILFKGQNKTIRRLLKNYIKSKTSNWRNVIRTLEKDLDLSKRVRCLNVYEIEKMGKKLLEWDLL